MTQPQIVWLRRDLRMADNPALYLAAQAGPVIAAYVLDDERAGSHAYGGASRWWLHQSLEKLAAAFEAAGPELVIGRGSSLAELQRVAKATGADAVFWNRRYEPASISRDRQVKEALRAAGLQAESFNGALLHEPWTIQNKAGRAFHLLKKYLNYVLIKVGI